ncbi:MAG: efflux RND transporter periplasmic adaptor subunit [Planctomycetota bacterium]|jgi:membrane fusion protein (multidrug efflux system)
MRNAITESLPRRAAVVLLVVGWALAAACLGGCKKQEQAETELPPVRVAVMAIEPIAALPDVVELPGVTMPNRVVRVAAEVAGRVEEVLATEGAAINCEDESCIIVRLNTDLLQAQADRYKSEAEYYGRDYDRLLQAQQRGVATKTEVDQAQMKAETFRALHASAKANLERAVIKAPISGIVNRLPVEQGEYLQPGALVAEIVDLDVIKVAVDVPERDVGYLTVGDEARIVANGTSAMREMVGPISYISQLADPSTYTSRIEIDIPNADRGLRTGQIVDAFVMRQTIPNAIMVPLDAVMPREKDHVVYVVEGSQATRRVVGLGLIKEDTIQVLSGLAEGDQLIVEGQRYVGPGQAVVIEPPAGEKLQAEQPSPGEAAPTAKTGSQPPLPAADDATDGDAS